MSKELDKTPDDEAKAAERPRKRRGGLRIPSDNVPRTSDPAIVAPVPADPNLAVSVAAAFGGTGPVDKVEPDADDGASPGRAPTDGVPAASEDAPTGPHRAAKPAGADDGESGANADTTASTDRTDRPDNGASASPAVGLGALADDDGVEMPNGSKNSGDSVEIAFDDEEVVQEARDAGGVTRTRAATMALSEDDLEEVMEEINDAAALANTLAGDNRKTIPMPALTMDNVAAAEAELKGDDDEGPTDVVTPTPTPTPAPAPAPAPKTPTPAPMKRPPSHADESASAEAASAVPAKPEPATPATAGELTAAPPAMPDATGNTDDEATAEIEVQPPPRAPEAATPTAVQDPADSGEIISDDLLEEVDEFAEAATPPPPPDPGADAGEKEEAAPAAAEAPKVPPPKPPPEARKPPPAPKGGRGGVAVANGAAAKRPRRRGKPWFEEIFEEDYLRTLPFLTPQATQAEAQFVMSSLSVEPGAQVLDVGCGYGRHAMELAARGYHVVALDASLPLLLRGADEAQRRGLDINFVHGDMRELTFESQFDGAYCLFSTFGYFDDETNKKAAQNIARALKPGARLVVEVLNRDYLIADLPSRVWWEGDGCVVLEEVEFNYFSSRIVSNRSVVFDDGRQLEQEISIRAYSLHEFGKLLHAAGFRVVEISGSMITRGRFFGNHSRDIIVVAEKRTPTANGE